MRIQRREVFFLILGGIVLITLLYYFVIISPAVSKERSLTMYIKNNEADLAKMVELKEKWERFESDKIKAQKALALRGGKFTLLSFLESVSREVGVGDRIQYMKPISIQGDSGPLKPEAIEMRLENINVEELVNFLYKIEYSNKLVNVKRIKIQRSSKDKTQVLKVTLQVNTYT